MNAEDFVRAFRQEKDVLLAFYMDSSSGSPVAAEVAAFASSPEQHAAIRRILDGALTDAYYGVLLALDGSASLGAIQQRYHVRDEEGGEVCTGDGTVGALAWEYFQGERAA